MQAVEKQLVSRHLAAVLERGFAPLMEAHRVPDLTRLHGLAARVAALDALKAAFKVRDNGARCVRRAPGMLVFGAASVA